MKIIIFNDRLYYLLFVILFSKLILKENIYKHQYLSLIILIICWILLNIPICLKFEMKDILPNFLNILYGAISPFGLVLIKYLSNKYYIIPLKTSLIVGLMSIIVTLIGFIIYSLIKYHDLTFLKELGFSNKDEIIKIIIYLILLLIFSTFLQLFILLILFYFSPVFFFFPEIIRPFLLWIVKTIKENENTTTLELVIYPIGYTIAIFLP